MPAADPAAAGEQSAYGASPDAPPSPGAAVPAENAGTTLTFSDFSGGEFGTQAPWNADPHSWTGTNIVRYPNGSLGPRNGLKQITTSGLGSGTLHGWGRLLVSNPNLIWLIVDTTVYVMTTAGVATSSGSIATTPDEPPQSVAKGTVSYVTSLGDKLYKIDHLAHTTTPIPSPNSPGLRCLAQYGVRTLAGGSVEAGGGSGNAPDHTNAPGNRLYFSAPSNPESWPAANYIDIGDTSLDICAILPQRTHCVIATTDGSWWILTGVPGVNPTLRKQLGGVSPAYPEHVIELGSGDLAYVIGSNTANGNQSSLGEFTGSQVNLYTHIPFGSGRRTGAFPTYTVRPLKEPTDWFCQSGAGAANTMALKQYETWSLHQWQVTPLSPVTLNGMALTNLPGIGQEFFTDGGGAGVPKIYQWRSYNVRPAFTSDSFMQPGDGTTTPFTASFTLPEYFDDIGRDLWVDSVAVDFVSWDTGSPATNHFDVTVNILRLWEGGASDSTTHPTGYDETVSGGSSAATTAGTRKRRRFEFSGGAMGNGFSITLSALRGVAIQKIQVHYGMTGKKPVRQYGGQRD